MDHGFIQSILFDAFLVTGSIFFIAKIADIVWMWSWHFRAP